MTRMTTREEMKVGIQIAARVAELRDLAEDTSAAFEQALVASGLPREHFRLRAMLLGLPSPPRKGA
jgi:hypothetical protein